MNSNSKNKPFRVLSYVEKDNGLVEIHTGRIIVCVQEWNPSKDKYEDYNGFMYAPDFINPTLSALDTLFGVTKEELVKDAIARQQKVCDKLTEEHYKRLGEEDEQESLLQSISFQAQKPTEISAQSIEKKSVVASTEETVNMCDSKLLLHEIDKKFNIVMLIMSVVVCFQALIDLYILSIL